MTDEPRLLDALMTEDVFPPTAGPLGAKLLGVDYERAEARYQFQPDRGLANPVGGVQGGILCAMLDDCIGTALATQISASTWAPTVEMKTNFMRPVAFGVPIYGTGRVLNLGKRIAHSEAELHDAQGRLLAKCMATAMLVQHDYDAGKG